MTVWPAAMNSRTILSFAPALRSALAMRSRHVSFVSEAMRCLDRRASEEEEAGRRGGGAAASVMWAPTSERQGAHDEGGPSLGRRRQRAAGETERAIDSSERIRLREAHFSPLPPPMSWLELTRRLSRGCDSVKRSPSSSPGQCRPWHRLACSACPFPSAAPPADRRGSNGGDVFPAREGRPQRDFGSAKPTAHAMR